MEDPLAFDDITLEFDSTASPILKRRWVHSDAVDEPVGFEAYTATSGVGSGTEHIMFADRQGSVIWVTELTCHGIFPPSATRVRPKEGTDDEANDTNRRADHWHPAGA
jgi:hypothetical protein